LTPNEEAQLQQTIEMFEVITQSQPSDYQSLEILKEAYYKLGRQKDVVTTAKRIAQAYVQQGQLSSAILEYESILQLFPGDPDVQSALAEIENRANNLSMRPTAPESSEPEPVVVTGNGLHHLRMPGPAPVKDIDDGRQMMFKVFVEGKLLSAEHFEYYWPTQRRFNPETNIVEPFIHILANNELVPLTQSLKILCQRSRLAYLPLERYDVDLDTARSFPRDACRQWCVLPFDRISKCVMVATANPFCKQAALDLEQTTKHRLLWYLVSPDSLVKIIRKTIR
jgi:tetratricopeptide (TPR) repeat protein